jgi:hypothetical protein
MTQDKKIAWEKFTAIYDQKEVNTGPIEEEQEESFQDSYDEESEEMMGLVSFNDFVPRKKIKTPFGYYEELDDFSPYNMFECWIGHTNFRITNGHVQILNKKIDGIGCLKVLSPYRFFIGIEKMFNFSCVRIQIQDKLCTNLDSIELDINDIVISKINNALFHIKDSEKWAVFVGNNGEIETIKNSEFESEVEYQTKLKTLKSLKNGNIITYDSL